MAMGPERSSASSSSSKPLHNFNLPCGLRWGNQRFLRCMKVNSNGEISAVERRPSSAGNANANAAVVSDGYHSVVGGKRKEREKFKEPPPVLGDYRRGSDFKVGFNFNFKLPPPQPPSTTATESAPRKFRSSESGGDDGGGIAAMREKLMNDLQTETDKIKDKIFREGLETEDQDDDNNPPSPATVMAVAPSISAATVENPSEAVDGALRPWNLRTRRAACKAPPTANGTVSGCATTGAGTSGAAATVVTGKGLKLDVMKPNSSLSPLRVDNNKSPRLRSGGATTSSAPIAEKKERVKFSVPLTRREIEEDFLAFAGRRPPRRPQKRPKYVQKQMDTLFPGLWLAEITADMYKVPETQ